MSKVIFVDIDGTLRDNNKNISTKTISTIKKVIENGNLVILCSGRPRKYTEDVSKQCFASKYIINSNGGSLYDYEEKNILYESIMDKQACVQLYNIAEKAHVRFIMNVGENSTVNILKNFDGSEVELKTDIITFVTENNIMQCTIADTEYEKIKMLEPDINRIPKVEIRNRHKSLIDTKAARSGTIYYDVTNIETSKGNAIRKFCKILKIDARDTIAIGDDYNDISMFNEVGYSVAMKNASDEVKKYANEVTASNEEDGVALFLKKYILDIEQ